MSKEKVGTKYYATTETSGTPIVGTEDNPIKLDNGIYTLATASLSGGETKYNCAYKYKITATLNTPITDGTDEDIKIKFSGDGVTNGSIEYILKQLIDAGTKGIDFTGTFENIKTGEDQTINVESTVENTNNSQKDFSGNSYAINIEPYEGAEGFSCIVAPIPPKLETKLSNNILSLTVTKTRVRYVGTNPENYICFGTSDKDICTTNPNTYMYRIIGVFASEQGEQHLKLIKYASMPSKMEWYGTKTALNLKWEESDLYKSINGSTYLDNTTYIPSGWSSKIINWKWTAVPKGIYQSEIVGKETSGVLCTKHSSIGSTSAMCAI